MPAPVQTYYTVDEVRAFPDDGKRYEQVLSPSTRNHDRFDKRGLYRDREIATYWIADGQGEFVEIWTPALQLPVIERKALTWHPAGPAEPLIIALESLFAD